jgi:hypothetical protein
MRKRRLFGIFLLGFSYCLYVICVLFEIGVGPIEGTTYSESFSKDPNFDLGYDVRVYGPEYIRWFIWLPLSLIALIGLVCLIWPLKPTINWLRRQLLLTRRSV